MLKLTLEIVLIGKLNEGIATGFPSFLINRDLDVADAAKGFKRFTKCALIS